MLKDSSVFYFPNYSSNLSIFNALSQTLLVGELWISIGFKAI